jgi:hypothetical protein
MVAALV